MLSARLGFLRPETAITHYDARFDDPATHPLAVDQLRILAQQMGLMKCREIEVLAGHAYVDVVRAVFAGTPVRVLAPYAGCRGIGDMMQLARRAIETDTPLAGLAPGIAAAMDAPRVGSLPSAPSAAVSARSDRQRSPAKQRGRPAATGNPAFIRRVFQLHEAERLSQAESLRRAASEFGIDLPRSYLEHPGVHFSRWRRDGRGRA